MRGNGALGPPEDRVKTPREPLFGEGFLEVARPSGHFSLSFPKIISGRIGGAVQPGWKWWQWRPIVGPLDAKAHLSLMPSGCVLDCNTPHRRKELAAGAPRQ